MHKSHAYIAVYLLILSTYTTSFYFAFLQTPILKIHLANKTLEILIQQINRRKHPENKIKLKENMATQNIRASIDDILLSAQNNHHIILTHLTTQAEKNFDLSFKSTFYGACHLLSQILKLKSGTHCYYLSISRLPEQTLVTTHLQCRISNA